MLEEIRVLALVRDGNTEAFTEIVKTYNEPIKRYLFRLTGDYETAHDLTQDTFIQAYQNILKTNNDLSLKAWLYRIATNNARQYLRRKKIIEFIPFRRNGHETPASETPADHDSKYDIQEAMLKLSSVQRTYMVLHFIEGFKYREIAGMLGVSEDSVCSCIARGKKAFKKIYNKNRRK